MNLQDIERELTSLKSWATKQGFGNSLQANRYGDFRVVWGEDNLPYIEASTNKGVVTSFQNCFTVKGVGRPELQIKNLTVDNLYAKTFNVKQITGTNGDLLVSDSAIVESTIGTTITFSDPSNMNLCPFVVNDKCIVKRIKYDKSLDIKECTFTVTAVSGRKVTVTWDSGTVVKGDIVVRSGNSSVLARQNMIYLSINDTNSPYIDCLTGLTTSTAYRTATPVTRVGNLAGITDADFGGALTGYGFYGTNVYLKGKLKIASVADIIGLPAILTTYRQSSTPSAPKTGELWYDTTAGEIILKRYNGSSWDAVGTDGTYIDGSGIYTGTLVAQNIIAGTGLVANLSILSTLTMGSAVTDGYIQSYGWNGTVNGFQIKGGATPAVSLIGGTITGGTIQTATGTGQRIVIAGATNDLKFYNSSNANVLSIIGNTGTGSPGLSIVGGVIDLEGAGADTSYIYITPNSITANSYEQNNITAVFYNYLSNADSNTGITGAAYAGTSGTINQAIGVRGDASGGLESFGVVGSVVNITGGTVTGYGLYGNAQSASTTNWAGYFNNGNVYIKNELQVGSNKFTVNSSGQITKVNNISATNKYTLIGDGTSFTPRLIAATDIDANVSNTEFGYLDGVTSAIQTQLNAKQATITGAATTIDTEDLTASKILVSDASGKVAVSTIASSELYTLALGNMKEANTTTTITCDGSTYVKYTGMQAGLYKGTTISTANDTITVDTGQGGNYDISFGGTATYDTAGDYLWGILINGSLNADLRVWKYIPTINVYNDFSFPNWTVALSAGDTVSLGLYGINGRIATVIGCHVNISKKSN